jgi:hypothetical protein
MSLEIEIKDVQIIFPGEEVSEDRGITLEDDEDAILIHLNGDSVEESSVMSLSKEQAELLYKSLGQFINR